MEGLNELLLQISNELGVGIDFLKSNFVQELPAIGRYLFVRDLLNGIVFSLIVSAFFIIIVASIIYVWLEIEYDEKEIQKKFFKKVFKFYIFINIISLISMVVPYLVSPKYWTIQQLMEIIR